MKQLSITQKAWALGALMVVVFIGVNLVFALVGYTTTGTDQCMQCHPDTNRLWKENRVHRTSITCVYCHSERASEQYAYLPTRLSNRKKELDQNCLKCHRNYMDEERAARTTMFAEKVVHESGKVVETFGPWSLKEMTCRGKFSCIACHKNISHDRAPSPTNLPRADYCGACHYHQVKDPFYTLSPKPRLVFLKDGKRVISPAIR